MLKPKPEEFGEVEIKCVFTGEVLGTASYLKSKYTRKPTQEQLGFVDARCDQCEIDHGNFKEMTLEYEKEFKKTAKQAEDFVKKNRKRADFDKEVEKLKDK